MPVRPRSLPVTTAAQAAARDRAAIAAGTPSFELMVRAGTATTSVILREFSDRLAEGVALFAGPGNNGGDAYIVAAQLARSGVRVRLHAAGPPRTEDAARAASIASPALVHGVPSGGERLVVDGLLGTGQAGALRGDVGAACERIALYRDAGAAAVALDIPTGIDATTGDVAQGAVSASLTVAYGTFKRAHLLARDRMGRVLLVEIGLDGHAESGDGAWQLAEASMIGRHLAAVPWDGWKTRRGVVGLVGGAPGMAGAIVLAARAALATGAGLAHVVVAADSVHALQASVPQALAHTRDQLEAAGIALDALGVGPGLGRDQRAIELLDAALDGGARTPLLLDADALTLLAGRARDAGRQAAELLADIARSRSVTCTPHVGEFARLTGEAIPGAFDARVAAVQSFALTSRATILLKGTPTVVCTPDGSPPMLVARGTPALSTGGSGDLLTGIITTLGAQGLDAANAAAMGAWLHGRAAEIATSEAGTTRGIPLDRVLSALPHAWRELEQPASFPVYVLAELPAVAS